MKASISAWSYRCFFESGKMDYMAFLDEVKRLKADGFEVFPNYVDQEDPGGHLKKIARKAKRLGLEISSVIAGNDFGKATHQERAGEIDRMKQWIAYTAEAGVNKMNVFTGYHVSGRDPDFEVYHVIDCYREVMPVAGKHDMTLCLENHSSVHPDADGLLAIIRAVGSPLLRTNPDPTNFVPEFTRRSPGALEAVYTETGKVAPLAANAHLKINEFAPDGEHKFVSVKRIHEIYRKAGYDGHVVLEVDYGAEQAPEVCAKGLALIRKYF